VIGKHTATPSLAAQLARGDGKLAGLVAHARELLTLGGVVRELLGSPLDRHIQVANLDEGRLVLLARSPAWAARARFMAGDLAERLAAYGARVSEIRIITRPREHRRIREPRQPARISARTARLLVNVATGLEPGSLRDRMLRLAGRRTKAPRGPAA